MFTGSRLFIREMVCPKGAFVNSQGRKPLGAIGTLPKPQLGRQSGEQLLSVIRKKTHVSPRWGFRNVVTPVSRG